MNAKGRVGFTIGDWVLVRGRIWIKHEYDTETGCVSRDVVELSEVAFGKPFLAQICGATHRVNGEKETEYRPEEGYVETSFTPTGSVFVFKVRRSLMNVSICVLPKQIEHAEAPKEGLKLKLGEKWTDREKEIVKGWPRDKRGRWIQT